jgi:hypothetical protein
MNYDHLPEESLPVFWSVIRRVEVLDDALIPATATQKKIVGPASHRWFDSVGFSNDSRGHSMRARRSHMFEYSSSDGLISF